MDTTNKIFYVYGLCDPRNEEVFYIGKGKGDRAKHHLKEKVGNTDKLKKINEIRESNLEVKIIYYLIDCYEEVALFLEEILIERIGRMVYRYGPLTNLLDGGTKEYYKLSLRGESAIEKERLDINFAIDKYPELKAVIDSIPKTSKKDEISARFQQYKSEGVLHVQQIIQSFDPNIFSYLQAGEISYRKSNWGNTIIFPCKYGVCEICLGDKETSKNKTWLEAYALDGGQSGTEKWFKQQSWNKASVLMLENGIIIFESRFLAVAEIAEKLRTYSQLRDANCNLFFEEINSTVRSTAKNDLIFEVYPCAQKDKLNITAKFSITKVDIVNRLGGSVYKGTFNDNSIEINTLGFLKGIYYIKINDMPQKKRLVKI